VLSVRISRYDRLQRRHRAHRVLRRVLDPGHDPPVARRSVRLPAAMERGAPHSWAVRHPRRPPRLAPAWSPSSWGSVGSASCRGGPREFASERASRVPVIATPRTSTPPGPAPRRRTVCRMARSAVETLLLEGQPRTGSRSPESGSGLNPCERFAEVELARTVGEGGAEASAGRPVTR
jgi:hypothetical protein